MDANEPVFGFSPAGASGLFLGLNELAEVRVLTQTFSVEYGGNGGGVIEAVTKSGSNHFHGSLFELHRDASLDAKNYFDLGSSPIPPFVRNQFGAALGGPLVHERTFFFANYEGFREVQASTAIATVPNALAHRGLFRSMHHRFEAAFCLNRCRERIHPAQGGSMSLRNRKRRPRRQTPARCGSGLSVFGS
jgi:hypothetical protein